MIKFKASYFDGKRSWGLPVNIIFKDRIIYIQNEDGFALLSAPGKDCQISPPLGSTNRTIKLPNGAQCETSDLGSIEAMENQMGRKNLMAVVHVLESKWRLVAGCTIGLVISILMFSKFVIPLVAQKMAYSLPPHLTEELSESTLEILDSRFLKPSQLDQDRQDELEKIFTDLHRAVDTEFNYTIKFRKSPVIGPNAFALPSGLILMTDELVEISMDDKELIGIMAHEVAHVKHRHGLRSVFQNAGIFLLISSLVGDVTSITSIAASLPTLLAKANYSREFEKEADRVAGLYLIGKGWGTKQYQDILLRITKEMSSFTGESVLSSHPVTEERVKYMQELEGSQSD
jgi:Zn-dependent protease with chaperone function